MIISGAPLLSNAALIVKLIRCVSTAVTRIDSSEPKPLIYKVLPLSIAKQLSNKWLSTITTTSTTQLYHEGRTEMLCNSRNCRSDARQLNNDDCREFCRANSERKRNDNGNKNKRQMRTGMPFRLRAFEARPRKH